MRQRAESINLHMGSKKVAGVSKRWCLGGGTRVGAAKTSYEGLVGGWLASVEGVSEEGKERERGRARRWQW